MTLLLIIYLASVPFAFLAMLQFHFDGWTDQVTTGDFIRMVLSSLAPLYNTTLAVFFIAVWVAKRSIWKTILWKKPR